MQLIKRLFRSRAIRITAFAAALVAVLVLAASPIESFGAALARTVSQVASTIAAKTNVGQPASQTALAASEAYEQSVVDATDRSLKSVVAIIATKDVPAVEMCAQTKGRITLYVPCKKGGTQSREVGGGTGFFVSADGLVLTNKHVVDDEDVAYTVLTTDGKRYPATVATVDPVEDLAVLRVQGTGFAVLPLGDSDGLKLGQTAIAIGNALGEFRNTVSVGVISGLARTVNASDRKGGTESLADVIQTDAAINPGNSGGPLLNLHGEVIGINTALASNAQGIGFALPSNRARRLIDAARQGVAVTVPYIGIRYTASPDGGIVLQGGDTTAAIEPNSPAAAAGLREGDRITLIAGKVITGPSDVPKIVASFDIGAQVVLTVIRAGVVLQVPVTIANRP